MRLSCKGSGRFAALVGVLVLATVAGCGDGSGNATTATTLMMTTPAAPPATSTGETTTTATTSPRPALFTADDLPDLVLAPEDGEGLAEGLEYRVTYSGDIGLPTVRHMTLIPPERLEALGFAGGYAAVFFNDLFVDSFGKGGRSLVTLALLFPDTAAASAARQVFVDSFDEHWAVWEPLAPVQGDVPGATGLCGTDNTSDLYPSTGFPLQVGNVVLVVGSQGGATTGEPLPEEMLRALATDLISTAELRLAEAQMGG